MLSDESSIPFYSTFEFNEKKNMDYFWPN